MNTVQANLLCCRLMVPSRISSIAAVPSRSISHCLDIVRKYDRENYLCTLLFPEPQRSFAAALHSFNVELAQIRDRSLKSDQAKLRFVFWRDIVDGIFQSKLRYDTPIARALLESIRGMKLSKYLFVKLIEARERQFNECAFKTLKDAERYAEETNVSLLYLINEAYGVKSLPVDHALSHLGRAQGLVNLIRGSIPLAQRRRTVVLPLDLLNKHNLSQEVVLRLLRTDPAHNQGSIPNENLMNMYHDLASVAHQHACLASKLVREAVTNSGSGREGSTIGVTDITSLRPIVCRQMLPLIPVASYLDRLSAKAQFDPRRLESHVDGLLPLRLAWHVWRNRIAVEPNV